MAPLAADISLYVFFFNLSRIKSHIAVINTFIRYRHPYLRERTLTRSTTPAARPLSVKQTEPAPIRFMVTIITLIYFFIAVYNYVIVCHFFFSFSLAHCAEEALHPFISGSGGRNSCVKTWWRHKRTHTQSPANGNELCVWPLFCCQICFSFSFLFLKCVGQRYTFKMLQLKWGDQAATKVSGNGCAASAKREREREAVCSLPDV